MKRFTFCPRGGFSGRSGPPREMLTFYRRGFVLPSWVPTTVERFGVGKRSSVVGVFVGVFVDVYPRRQNEPTTLERLLREPFRMSKPLWKQKVFACHKTI